MMVPARMQVKECVDVDFVGIISNASVHW